MSDSALRVFSHLLPVLCLILLQGCAEDRPAVPQPSAEYVVMVDEQGTPENILIDQFFKNTEQADRVKVLVIDKQGKGKALIPPAKLLKQNPNAGRYLIFKHDDPKRSFDDPPQ